MAKRQNIQSVKVGEVARVAGYNAGMLIEPTDGVVNATGRRYELLRTIETDPHFYAVWEQRIGNILQLDVNVSEENITPQAYELIVEFINSIDIDSLITSIINSKLYGFSVVELFWGMNDAGSVYPVEVSEKPQEWFAFDIKHNLFFVRNGGNELMPKRKFLLCRNKYTDINPYGKGIISGIFPLIRRKRNIVDFLLRYLERYGTPYVIAKQLLGVELTGVEKSVLENSIRNAGSDAGIILPSGIEIELQEANRKESVESYLETLRWIDREISKNVLGHADAADSVSGQLGNQETAENVVKRIALQDKRFVEKYLQKLVNMITEINFPATVAAPKITLTEQMSSGLDRAQRDKVLYDMGVRFTPDYITANYGIMPEMFAIEQVTEQQPQALFTGNTAQNTIDTVTEEDVLADRMNDVLSAIERNLNKTPEENLLQLGEIFNRMNRKRITSDLETIISGAMLAGMASAVADDETVNGGEV